MKALPSQGLRPAFLANSDSLKDGEHVWIIDAYKGQFHAAERLVHLKDVPAPGMFEVLPLEGSHPNEVAELPTECIVLNKKGLVVGMVAGTNLKDFVLSTKSIVIIYNQLLAGYSTSKTSPAESQSTHESGYQDATNKDLQEIVWENPTQIGAEIEIRERTDVCSDSNPLVRELSLKGGSQERTSCNNDSGVCYRFRYPQNNADYSEWFATPCRGQTEKLPYGFDGGPTPQRAYWYCSGGEGGSTHTTYITNIFEGSTVEYPTNLNYARQFVHWLIEHHPEINPNAIGADCQDASSPDSAKGTREHYRKDISSLPIEDVIWSPSMR